MFRKPRQLVWQNTEIVISHVEHMAARWR